MQKYEYLEDQSFFDILYKKYFSKFLNAFFGDIYRNSRHKL